MQAAHQPAQGEVVLRRLVEEPLQHNRGGNNGSRVGRWCWLQPEPPDKFLSEIKFSYGEDVLLGEYTECLPYSQ